MRILTRYLLRAHLGPFLFAFTALTGLLFLNAVAQRMEMLVGKGLEWSVVVEFLILSLPHTVALTLPMSVLVAVLYAFGDLTANNEITAIAAGGVNPTRLVVPLVAAGALLAAGMLYFNDRVLPEANHQLKVLMLDIGQKSPTFELDEQVMNEIRAGQGRNRYFLQASRIDTRTNELEEVVIWDVSDPTRKRTTYADRGRMAFNSDRTSLFLTLFDGVTYEVENDRPGGFQRLQFGEQVVALRGVGDQLERRTGGARRGEREMTIGMLEARAREHLREQEELREEIERESRQAVERALGIFTPDADSPAPLRPAVSGAAGDGIPRDVVVENLALTVRTNANRARTLELQAAQLRVEVHKKYSIAFACLVFVLLGAPTAVRFPRGGVGLAIAVSVAMFAIYWMGLIGGEKLADEGIVHPFWAMWTPNLVFLVASLLMVNRMDRWVATSRGGGWQDLLHTLRKLLLRPAQLIRRNEAQA